MTDNSRSESMEDVAQQPLLERHRSPSATEIYTNARSYLFDSKDEVILVPDDQGENENKERGNIVSGNTTGSVSGANTATCSVGLSSSRAMDKIQKIPTRYRSQSAESVPAISMTTSTSAVAGVAAISTKKPSLDRARTDSLSSVKDKMSSTFEKTNSKRQLDKPIKKNGSFSHVSSSPEASKQVVPPLSTTPELSRTSNKSKHKSSSTKKLVSRSYNDGGAAGNLKTTSANAAMFSTPPRHVGSLRDELTHTPPNIHGHSHLTTSSPSIPDNVQSSASANVHTPVRDSSPSRQSGKTSKVTPTSKLKMSIDNSRASSPSPPVDSARSSRSNSGSSNSQLGVISPLTVDNVEGGKFSNGQSITANVHNSATSIASSSSHSSQLPVSYGNSGSSVFGTSGSSGGGGTGSTNPFARSSLSSEAGPLGGGTQPKEKNNIFERRLQEAQALNRKELVEGSVMHEFSLWKNFSNTNANAALGGADIEKSGKDSEVAPPKRPSRLRLHMNRATDEAMEHSDRDIESPRSANGSSSSNHRGNVKVKPLSPVSTTGNVKPKSGRKHSISKMSKNSKVSPIASLSRDDDENQVSGVDEVSSSNTVLKSATTNRVKPLQTIDTDGSFEVEDEFGVMQQYEVFDPVPSVSPPLTPSLSSLHEGGNEHVVTGGRGLATNFRSMVGSCKKSANSASASDMDSILSERSVEISEPFTMHRSVTDSIASIESSVYTNYEREGFEEYNELAIFGVAHEDDEDVNLSFISEDDNCVMVPLSDEPESNRVFSDDLDAESYAVKRTLILNKGVDEDLLEESVDAKELEEDGDSLLLSHSQSQELSNSSTNHVPFSPRAIMDEEIEYDDCPPPLMGKGKTAKDASFSNELLDASLDQSAEVINASFDSNAKDYAVPLLQPLVTDGEIPFVIPALASHALIKGKSRSPHLIGDMLATGSPPPSSRLPTERTTDRPVRSNFPSRSDTLDAKASTCMMSATLGNPPPLLKANLQAKQSIKRNNFQDKGSIETKKSEKRVKSRKGSRRKRSSDNDKHISKPVQESSPRIMQSKSEAADTTDEVDSIADDHSISSELSEMSNSDFDPDDPFPMTEAEKEELQLQQHRQFLQMGGFGHLGKNGALTAPAVLGSQDSSEKQIISGSIEAQQLKSQQEEEQPADQMYQLDNGCQWKKGNDVLGQGSFGQVYKGMNYDTGELLAVKQICLSDGTEGEVNLLRKEIDVMKDLNHPNIVRYVGTSISSRYLFIVLEYVPGGSVAGTLSQFGAFSEPLIKRFVTQIIAGVEYLHQKQIIHRDIKGANVLVTDAGVAKLADFGCSKQLGGMVTASLEESMRIIRGSVPWMAPEVIKQVGHGRSADLWSVGATMIEMATAKHPWPEFSNNLAALFHVATSKDPPPIPAHLSPACALFMSRCLVIDPKERATASELKDDLFLQAAT